MLIIVAIFCLPDNAVIHPFFLLKLVPQNGSVVTSTLRSLACRGQDGSLLRQAINLRGLPCPALPAGVSCLRYIFNAKIIYFVY
ncbi:hypothetical protein JOC27_000667 [Sporolactobacillus spathodeae]|uniref:Secreted protein n=1 Tax=Sporolactobacillus spathodeae TaxID=1465502 RepID=A0ABS2Q6D9_9BACL|nr:hypothetical protein [Sporolactobacillus spathodeae]